MIDIFCNVSEDLFEVLFIKNVNCNVLPKLHQYLGKYRYFNCLYMGHANKNSIHLQPDLWSKICKVVVLLVDHDTFLIQSLMHETRHGNDIKVF